MMTTESTLLVIAILLHFIEATIIHVLNIANDNIRKTTAIELIYWKYFHDMSLSLSNL
jgi:hypothetical protein